MQIEKSNMNLVRQLHAKKKFISNVRFMTSSLSSLGDNFAEGLHNRKSKDSTSCLKYVIVKDELSIFKCLEYSERHKNN